MSTKQEKRQAYFAKVERLFTSYQKVILVSVDNIRSKQISMIRRLLRGKAELLFGKNTIILRALQLLNDAKLNTLIPHIKLNVGFVFTNDEVKPIMNAFTSTRRKAAAKTGLLAPSDVVVEPMLTTMGPDMHSFFASLGIDTKINKGKIEIVHPVNLIKKGEIVNQSQSTLLQKLEIEPFYYAMSGILLYDNGEIYGPEIFEADEEGMTKKWNAGVAHFVSAALGLNYPCLPAVPHIFVEVAKSLIGAGVECDIEDIPLVKKCKDALKK